MFKTPRDIGSTDIRLGLCINVDDNQFGPNIFETVEATIEKTDSISYEYKQVIFFGILSSPIII